MPKDAKIGNRGYARGASMVCVGERRSSSTIKGGSPSGSICVSLCILRFCWRPRRRLAGCPLVTCRCLQADFRPAFHLQAPVFTCSVGFFRRLGSSFINDSKYERLRSCCMDCSIARWRVKQVFLIHRTLMNWMAGILGRGASFDRLGERDRNGLASRN